MMTNCKAKFLKPIEGEKTSTGRPSITHEEAFTALGWLETVSANSYRQGVSGTAYGYELKVAPRKEEINIMWRVEIDGDTYCVEKITPRNGVFDLSHVVYGLSYLAV